MDLRTSALVACVTWAFGATIAAIGMLAFINRDAAPTQIASSSFRPTRSQPNQLSLAAKNQISRQAEVARSLASQVASLESSLAESRRRLRTAQQQVAKYRAESDASINIALDLLEQDRVAAGRTELETQDPDVDLPPLAAPEASAKAEESAQPEETLELLREQIAEKDRELDALEEEQEETLSRLLSRDLAMRDESARILTRLGADAAGEVAESLRHPDPEIRIWAANVLTKLGLQASDTIGELQMAAKDDDPRVRSAVAEAINAVSD